MGSDVRAGVVVAMTTLLNVCAYAAFLAGGPIATLLPTILASALVSTAVVSVVLARAYSLPSAMGGPAGNAAAVAGAALAAVVAHDVSPASRAADVAVVLALTALLPGLAMLGLAAAKLGRSVRYVPYPVVAGFLAGTGWLLLVGAVRMAGPPESLAAAVVTLLAFRLATARYRWPGTFPATATCVIAATWLAIALSRVAPDVARAHGWLFARLAAAPPAIVSLDALRGANWGAIGGAWGAFAWVVIVVVAVSMLNGAALEVAIERDESVDRDLFALGGANVLASLTGGFGSQMVLPTSLAAHALAPRSRVPGYVVAAIALLAALASSRILPVLPPFVFAAIIAFYGLRFLEQYVRDASRGMSRGETAIAIVMLATTAFLGLQNALVVGLALACAAFVGAAGRSPVVRRETSLRDARSRIERGDEDRAVLEARGHTIAIVRLQGHLFFGSASTIEATLRPLVDRDVDRVAIVLDFTLVGRIDVSAALVFTKIARRARRRSIAVVFAGVAAPIERELRRNGAIGSGEIAFATLDAALEVAEERLLAGEPPVARDSLAPEGGVGYPGFLAALAPFVDTLDLASDERLFATGDEPDAMYVLVVGRLLVRRDGVRLRTLVARTLVGEMGFYTNVPRSAEVVAIGAARVERLTRAAYERLVRDDPTLGTRLHREIVRLQADRLRSANAETLAFHI